MIFDDNISEEVSLPQVLDYMITEGEKPSVIVDFLCQYDEDMVLDIIDHSCCALRMFDLNFIRELSFSYVLKFYSKIKNYDKSPLKYMCWQIMQSDIDESVKSQFRTILQMTFPSLKHPYGGYGNSYMKTYDSIFLKSGNIDEICEFFNSMKIECFSSFCDNMSSSLWLSRILQIDFLEGLSLDRQYVFVKSLLWFIGNYSGSNFMCRFGNGTIEKFLFQIMKSDLDISLKMEIYDGCVGRINVSRITDDYSEIVDIVIESSSYSEMMIKLSLNGFDNLIEYLIFYLLFNPIKRNLKILVEMCENDREMVESHFKIVELVESLK